MVSRKRRTAALAAAGAAVVALAGTSTASAATTVGSTAEPPERELCFRGVYLQRSVIPGGPSYTVPETGVITKWAFDPGLTGGRLRLKVFRPDGNPRFVAQSDEEGTGPGDPLTHFDARVPVRAGDRIGIEVVGDISVGCVGATASPDDQVDFDSGVHPIPSPFDPGTAPDPFRRVNVEAIVEPDTDRDGFGDETQDRCPTDPERREPCLVLPPATPVTPPAPTPPSADQPATPAPETPPAQPEPLPSPPIVAPRDAAAPLVRASGRKRQRLSSRRGLVLSATADEAAVVSASAKVNVRGVRLRAARIQVIAGGRGRLELRASKSALAKLRRVRKGAVASVTIVARDVAGNTTTKRLRIRVRA